MYLTVRVRPESLHQMERTIAQKVRSSLRSAANDADEVMQETIKQARDRSMVATGQTQNNTRHFPKTEDDRGIRISGGILPGGNFQELYTENMTGHQHRGRVHTNIEQHVKAKCSRSILGKRAGNPSEYRANPRARKGSFRKAIINVMKIDVVESNVSRGQTNRYYPASMVTISELFRIFKQGFMRGFHGSRT